jgi:hypothetical protein
VTDLQTAVVAIGGALTTAVGALAYVTKSQAKKRQARESVKEQVLSSVELVLLAEVREFKHDLIAALDRLESAIQQRGKP